MQDLIKRISELVAADQLERAIEELQKGVVDLEAEVSRELVQHQATLNKSRVDTRRGLLTWSDEERIRTRVRFAVLELLAGVQSKQGTTDLAATRSLDTSPGSPSAERAPVVFISYSHTDRLVVEKLKAALRERGIEVRLDSDSLNAGEDIEAFILRSVRDTDATLCLVSRASLLSPWVAMETLNRFHQGKWAATKKFIACYVDDGFFNAGFRLEATKEIDARIKKIDALIPRYIEQRIDTDDLNRDKSRLFELRNNLGTILQRLKGSLCLNVLGLYFDESVERIVDTLKR